MTLVSKLNVVIEVTIITTGTFFMGGAGNVVGIATAYGWTVRRSNLGKVRRDADLSPPSSAEVKNRVELYLFSL